jgi:hypothetical protein
LPRQSIATEQLLLLLPIGSDIMPVFDGHAYKNDRTQQYWAKFSKNDTMLTGNFWPIRGASVAQPFIK